MGTATAESTDILQEIIALPQDIHSSGSLGQAQLQSIVRHCSGLNIKHSLETGCGKSALLFSHLSPHHMVFALEKTEQYESKSNKSISNIFNSPLLNQDSVELIAGPTQQTLPKYEFDHKIQIALLDGPHAYPFADLEYFYIYPLLEPGGILIIDDITIPSVHNMFRFIEADDMFSLLEVVKRNTAFFRRTDAPTLYPYGDGHWLQNYNKTPIDMDPRSNVVRRVGRLMPSAVKKTIRRLRSRNV